MLRFRPCLIAVAMSLGCPGSAAAQDAKPAPERVARFAPANANDPCGNPAVESSVWLSLTGKVVKVPAGDRLVIDMPRARGQKARRGVVVRLVGIEAPAPSAPFGRESRQRLESLALGRVVSVMTKSEVAYESPLPGEIVGVARLNRTALDLNFEQVRAGLARHKDAEPYTVSNYAQCRYRLTEGEAREAGRGLWRQGRVSR